MTTLTSLATDPALGLPFVILLGAVVGWILWNVRDRPIVVQRPTPRPLPDRDPVSRSYHNFRRGVFSDVLGRALARLDRTARSTYGVPADRLPWWPGAVRRLAPTDPRGLRALRRLVQEVEGLRSVTVRREAGIWIRFDLWRDRPALLERFRQRLGPVLEAVERTSGPAGAGL
ncbi:MAG TPA: hypothetical protein VGV64_02095 [Thermoplasmata archaeon]|nr:hypothetical protein [Thermoplasmata archaeon]HEV2428623.1 hypothetical protein [Thermoplasmata archaeon]HEV2449174.1 hypothetical protein [Thermoplasmata archaeon]